MVINYEDYIEEALELFLYDDKIKENKSAIARFLHHKYSLEEYTTLDNFRWNITKYLNRKIADREIIVENVKLAKQKQKNQDINRIERKAFREHARLENAVAVYANELKKHNEKYGAFLKTLNIKPLVKNLTKRGVGVIQVTDLHGNELIDLPHNKYDFIVLSKRLKLYINKALKGFKDNNIEKVAFLVTGD